MWQAGTSGCDKEYAILSALLFGSDPSKLPGPEFCVGSFHEDKPLKHMMQPRQTAWFWK